METIQLGRTGIEVTRICIGCWQGAGWASSDDERFVRTVQHAIDSGLNFLDTAVAYGGGHSEDLVGKAIAGASCPEQVDQNLGALGWALEAEDRERLAGVNWPLSSDLQPHDALWGWHPRAN